MLCASMEFNGPSGGRLTLLAPQSLCRTVAANAMGVDSEDEVSIETTMDTVKELLNITCGNLLTATWGTAPVFDLTSPRVEAVSPDESQCIAQDPESCHFLVDDDYTVILRLTPTEHPAGSPSVSAS